MAKIWRYFPDQCPNCGNDAEVYTDENSDEGWVFDSDPVKCVECCAKGSMVVYDVEEVGIDWDEETFCEARSFPNINFKETTRLFMETEGIIQIDKVPKIINTENPIV